MKPNTLFCAGLLTALAPLAATAQTDDATLLRCAQNTEAAARLACFDELTSRARQRQARSPSTPDPAKVVEFGRPPKLDASDIDVLESRVPGPFEGWSPRQRFTLANGQVWEISDDSSAFGRGRDLAVKIRRGSMGSYFIEFDGVTRSPRVRRVD